MFNLGDFSMKKTLVALASMAALGAFAQSSVTMYGIVEATVDIAYKDKTDATATASTLNAAGAVTGQTITRTNTTIKPTFRVQDGNSQGVGTSRIGWRGTEDLGGGLKANFQLEMGLRVDDGCVTTGAGNVCSSGDSGGNLFGRNAWVGASGGFGEVRIGRQVMGSFSTQANGWAAGSSSGLYEVGGVAPAMAGVRYSDAIRYLSPNFSGLDFNVALRANESKASNAGSVTTTLPVTPFVTTSSGDTKAKIAYDLAVNYANGPLYLGFGYYSAPPAATAGATAPAANLTTATSGDGKNKGYTLSAAYDLGVVKPFLNITRVKGESVSATANANSTTNVLAVTATGSQTKHNAWTLGVRAPMGAATLIAAYGSGKLTTEAATLNATTTAGVLGLNGLTDTDTIEKRKAFNIGMQYPLSKRTMIEANYGQIKFTTTADASAANFNGAAFVSATDTLTSTVRKVSAINVGLRHTF
jgi:predicted porin